ncbi:helix-turn-helix domain-containing protein [Candidatus Bipolaricaulota bacterium]|nr:helix-turn-helix domain-containing protein [Candidatus Bipolaricaulota bacterium]
MCKNHECCTGRGEHRKRLEKLKGLAKALHGPPRWDIIEIIGEEEVTTGVIREKMKEKDYELSRPGLYYHLSELKDAGIIEVSGYLEEGRGAPEKKWTLKRRKIEIDLLGGGE